MLKIEAGKHYRTRDGRKVGPLYEIPSNSGFRFSEEFTRWLWRENGVAAIAYADLISEWQDEEPTGPVRTVTRKEVVPGKYGAVAIIDVGFKGEKDYAVIINGTLTAQELREAAKVLNELASALEENANVQV